MDISKKNLTNIYSKYMIAVGIFGHLLFYVQAYEIIRHHKTEGISLTAFSIALFSLLSWLIYGLLIKNKVLIISNIVGTLGALLVICCLLSY